MRVLVACDSFKDALPAAEVCRAIAEGLRESHPEAAIVQMPLADGGEGALAVLMAALDLRPVELLVADPLMRPVTAAYGLSADGRTAVVEMAAASGLQRLAPHERDPLAATTFGTGQLLADARRRGARRVLLAIGGSATNDAGLGAAAAMGWRFLDAAGAEVEPCGGAMDSVVRLVAPPEASSMDIEVICDVDNPLFGPDGAAWTYGRQKGADDAALARLDRGLRHIAGLAQDQLGIIGLAEAPGAGAAGGLGFGAVAFLGAVLRRGVEVVLDAAGFDEAAAAADLVVTGEGRLDGQTLRGKLIAGVCARASAAGAPVIALCGTLAASPEQLANLGLKAAYAINQGEGPLPERLARTAQDLRRAAAALAL